MEMNCADKVVAKEGAGRLLQASDRSQYELALRPSSRQKTGCVLRSQERTQSRGKLAKEGEGIFVSIPA